ncbi:MAG: hypothetical protein ACK4WC_15920 [Rubrimonas sp.]
MLYKGKDGAVTFTPATDGAAETLVGQITSWEISEEAETTDGTSMGDGARINEPLFNAWSGSVGGWWDKANAGQLAAIQGAVGLLAIYPEGRGAGKAKLSGQAVINSRSRNADVGSLVSFQLQFQSRGALAEGADV